MEETNVQSNVKNSTLTFVRCPENISEKTDHTIEALVVWYSNLPRQNKYTVLNSLITSHLKKYNTSPLLEITNIPDKEYFYSKIVRRPPLVEVKRSKKKLQIRETLEHNFLKWFENQNEGNQLKSLVSIINRDEDLSGEYFFREANKLKKMFEFSFKKTEQSKLLRSRSILRKKSIIPLSEGIDVKIEECKKFADELESDLEKSLLNSLKEVEGAYKRKTSKVEVMDTLQLLPVSINRIIYSYLDPKSKHNLKSVNRYWRTMANEIKKEESARHTVNKTTKKTSTQNLYKGKCWGKLQQKYTALATANAGSTIELPKDSKDLKEQSERMDSEDSGPAVKELAEVELTLRRKPFKSTPLAGDFERLELKRRFEPEGATAAGKRWVAWSDGSEVVLLGYTGQECGRLLGHCSYVTALAWHPSRGRLLSAAADLKVLFWDAYSRKTIFELSGHNGLVTSLSLNEFFLCSASLDLTVRLYDQESGTVLWKWDCHVEPVGVALDDCRILYIAGVDGCLDKVPLTYLDHDLLENCPEPKCGQSEENITKVLWGQSFVQIKSGTEPRNPTLAHVGEVTALYSSPPLVFSGGVDGLVKVWHPDFFAEGHIRELDHAAKRVNAIGVCCLHVVTASEDGALRIWDLHSSSLLRTIVVNADRRPILGMTCLSFPDHIKIVINNEDAILVLVFQSRRRNQKVYKGIKCVSLLGKYKFKNPNVSSASLKLKKTLI